MARARPSAREWAVLEACRQGEKVMSKEAIIQGIASWARPDDERDRGTYRAANKLGPRASDSHVRGFGYMLKAYRKPVSPLMLTAKDPKPGRSRFTRRQRRSGG